MARPGAGQWDAAREPQVVDGMRLFQAQRLQFTKAECQNAGKVPLERITAHGLTPQYRASLEKGKAAKSFPALLDSRFAISRSRQDRESAAHREPVKIPIQAGQAFRSAPEDLRECDRIPGDIGGKLECFRPFLPNTC